MMSLPNVELLQTEQMIRGVVWLVNIFSFLTYDWMVKDEW
jgi:hypothetical protein